LFAKNKGWIRGLMLAVLMWGAASTTASVNVLTYHNDNARTGQNTNESILTPANVASANFGMLFGYAVDGFVYAQPLVVTNVTIPGKGVHDVVYVATEHDSVYAFDANTNSAGNASPLWQVSFINPAAGVTTLNTADVSCPDLWPEIGITSTPVIDFSSRTLYVEARTKEVTANNTAYYHRLHALDLATGVEKFGGPAVVQASVTGTGDGNDGAGNVPFDPLRQLNRAALLLNNGIVYMGFSSLCDAGPYHGWLIGYGAQTLALSNVFNVTPNGGDGGIWQSGGGPAVDANGNFYLMSGNGTFDTNVAVSCFGNSFLKFRPFNGLQLADYFTPYNQADLDSADLDVGSGGPLVLPDEVGGGATNQHLLVGAGKDGTIYLLNREFMGQFNPAGDTQIVQSLPGAIGRCFSTPAYFNKTIYYLGAGDVLKAFSITNAYIVPTPGSQSSATFGFPGATPSVSANGTKDAIVWVLQASGDTTAVLRAYNATNLAQELYNSGPAGGRDDPGLGEKFSVPTVANGRVYVGAAYQLAVFGLGSFVATPVIYPAGGVFTNAVLVTISDATSGSAIYYTLDGSLPTTNSILYSGLLVLTNSATIHARAFKVGAVASGVTTATFLSATSIGSGTGLAAAYYSDQLATFVEPPTLRRTDATINFDWGDGSPDPNISADTFTAMWTGAVLAQFDETYNFYTTTSDGVRLWVNGQLIIDKWVDQGPTQWGGAIALHAGTKYPITLQYYEHVGAAVAMLAWSSPSTVYAIIPQNQLYPTFPSRFLPVPGAVSNGNFNLQLSGLVGKGYILQATTNFTTWVSLQTNSPPVNPNIVRPTNLFNFTDPAAGNFRYRFYRALQLP
jgi:hypothetical protein